MSIAKDPPTGALSVGPAGDPVEAETAQLLDSSDQDRSAEAPKNAWAGAKDFEGLRWWQMPSVKWILGPFFLFSLAFGGVLVPRLNLTLDLICRKHFADQNLVNPDFIYAPIILGADNPQCYIPEIKKTVSMFTMAMNLMIGIMSAITAPRLGQLSDRYGRTKFLALASCGGCVAEFIIILCAKYPDAIHYNWLLVASFFDGLTGSFTTGNILTYSYTSDCTPPSKRAVSIGYMQACLFTGLAFGPLLASYFVAFTGSLLSIFYVTLGCHIFFVLFVGFVVPESLIKKRQLRARERHAREVAAASASGSWLSSVRRVNVLAPLKALYPTGSGTSMPLRTNLLALAVIEMILFGSAMSAATVILLYCESDYTWGWGTVESSRFISILSLVRVVVLLALLPAINYFFRTRPAARRARKTGSTGIVEANEGADGLDCWLLRLALLSDIVGSLGYLFSRTATLFVISGMVTALGGLGSATIQAAVTKHVPPDRVGQVLGAIGVLHCLSRILGPIAFNSLYAATVGKFDQAIFVLLAALFGVAFLASLMIKPHGEYRHFS
ncbi:MFS general substrate transporter [Sodiomyces alkalinus F11]|uniref:MFS general substrate transporter n=1 Tax=Sodiomyces alkalinus (strain CBS 110278 / VKM F-3762 / F11) TaxID=1314773 RepID=A0A3N2Q530_SODAK|nr:MFS general substrate transporter [Sodiomyces alkalinus F11]ROT41807.1 MFS general substrate transporter [Sodiomyces alkalinus F11]